MLIILMQFFFVSCVICVCCCFNMYTSEFYTNTLSFSDLHAWCHTGTLFTLYVFHITYAVLLPLYILLHISHKYCFFLISNF